MKRVSKMKVQKSKARKNWRAKRTMPRHERLLPRVRLNMGLEFRGYRDYGEHGFRGYRDSCPTPASHEPSTATVHHFGPCPSHFAGSR